MTVPPECLPKLNYCCADQKQGKNKNLEIFFFGGDVTICMYPVPCFVTFCH